MKISIGSDHGGYTLANTIIQYLRTELHDVILHLPSSGDKRVDYPDYAFTVANDVSSHFAEFGILICRSSVGMSIAANKCRNIRAALCTSSNMASAARAHNDINVLCLGADYMDEKTAVAVVNSFLKTKFLGGIYLTRLEKISNYEKKHYTDH